MKWFIAVRPWSFTASIIPVTLGAILAFSQGYWHPWLFIITLFAGVAVHAGTNYLNTYGDFVSGVDTIESAPSAPELVTGLLQPKAVYLAGMACLALAAILGAILAYFSGWLVIVFGALGLLGGYTYTTGKYPYKYYGIGPFLVFLLMGPLMTMPAYYIQTGFITWTSALISLPIGFLVTGIMHSNDLRDTHHDQLAKIKTLTLYLGFSKARLFYGALYLLAFLSIIMMAITQILPPLTLLPLLLLPQALKGWRSLNPPTNETLAVIEAHAAKMHFLFGVLFIVGFGLSILVW